MRNFVGILLAIGLATPAHANWQGFDWGMTEEQVEAANSEVSVYRLETLKKKRMRPSTSTLGGVWTQGDQEYQAYFFFDPDGKLEFIDIEPLGVECSELNNLLADHFGDYNEEISSLGPARRTTRHWRLGRTVELNSLVLHFASSDNWSCNATIRNPVPWLSR